LTGVNRHQRAGLAVYGFEKFILGNKVALSFHVQKPSRPKPELLRVQIEDDVAAAAAVLPTGLFAAVDNSLGRLGQAHVEGDPFGSQLVAHSPPVAAQS
jgi:hypothetical protein